MLNRSADHALRAVLYLAQHDGRCSGDAIANALGVPRNYLGKVLNTLVHAGVLHSIRGPSGGFILAVPADTLTVACVLAPFQDAPTRSRCLLGDRACDAARPCAAHLRWSSVFSAIAAFYRETTVALLLQPLDVGGAVALPLGIGGRGVPGALRPPSAMEAG